MICEKTGWSWDYVLWGIPWNMILWGMADQPGFDESEEKEVKASPTEGRQFINQWKQRSGRST